MFLAVIVIASLGNFSVYASQDVSSIKQSTSDAARKEVERALKAKEASMPKEETTTEATITTVDESTKKTKNLKQAGGNQLSDWNYSVSGGSYILDSYKGTGTDITVPGRFSEDTSKSVILKNGFRFPINATRIVVGSNGYKVKASADATKMFYDCRNLTTLDVKNLDTSAVTNMKYMFHNCKALKSLDVSGFDTRNVTSMWGMFFNCDLLKTLNIQGFDTRNVTDMSFMFGLCHNLTSIDVSGFDTSNVTMMEWMFACCNSLTRLDLSHFDVSKVAYRTDNMLLSCYNMWYLDLSHSSWTEDKIKRTLFNNTGDKIMHNAVIVIPYTEISSWKNTNYRKPMNITYHANGGTIGGATKKVYLNSLFVPRASDVVKSTRELTQKYTPTRTGWTFTGWYTDAKCSAASKVQPNDNPINLLVYADKTLYAGWKTNHPVIHASNKTIKVGDSFNPRAGVSATDVEDGNLTSKIKVSGTVNTKKAGTYKITYSVTDSHGAKTTKTISVKVEYKYVDEKNSDYVDYLFNRVSKTAKKSQKLQWKRVSQAHGYMVYGARCGAAKQERNRMKCLKVIKGNKTTSWTHTKLKKGTYYKYYVTAYTIDAKTKKKKLLTRSRWVHSKTKGGKRSNPSKITVNKSKVTLKVKKTVKLKVKVKSGKNGTRYHAFKVRYASSNRKIATVSSKGVVKAVKKGTCYIYSYTQNGLYKTTKVTVK